MWRAHENLGASQWLFYTSGSTGLPKGVRHTDATLYAVARGMVDHLMMTGSDRNGIAFPIAHVGGPINLMAGLLSGATLILIEIFDPSRRRRCCPERASRWRAPVPRSTSAISRPNTRTPPDLCCPALRCCPGGRRRSPREYARSAVELGSRGIISRWGLTEAPVLTMGRPTDSDVKLSETEGRPLPGVQLRIVSPDEHVLTPGEPGELAHASQLMVGYVDSSLDAAAFDGDGYLRTGDLGTIDADGHMRITGRIQRRRHPQRREHRDGGGRRAVAAPSVRRRPRRHRTARRPDGGASLAVLELAPGAPSLDVGAIGAYLGGLGLRRHAWPEQVEIVDRLPRSVAGKIEKVQLKRYFSDPPAP